MSAITAELGDDDEVRITNGTHSWFSDEPQHYGGQDIAPSPYDQLLGALAACTCITLSRYAKKVGITLSSVSVEYRHERVHARDCDQCDDERTGMIDRISSRIFIDGDFDETTRARLYEVAQRCPVHKTLACGVAFDDTVFVG